MARAPFIPLRKLANRFIADRRGNIAVLFGLASIPLITFVGAAVDYSRAAAARTKLQAAVDSAVLMASKDFANKTFTDPDAISSKVDSYLRALYTSSEVTLTKVETTYTKKSSDGTSTVAVVANGKMPTSFMKLANITEVPFTTSSTSTWGATRLRVAMALDVTGSMKDDGKLDAMKKSAKSLIDTLKKSATGTPDVYISIIPFNEMVKVGTDKKSAGWVDWHAILSDTGDRNYDSSDYGQCSNTKYITKALCEAKNKTWTFAGSCSDWRYSTSTTCKNAGKTWTEKRDSWQGCVTDRDLKHTDDNDTTKTAPTTSDPATLFVAKNYTDCKSSILPMKSAFDSNEADNSTDDTTLKGKINNLIAQGGTNQPIGLHWAWMALQLGDPLNTPAKDEDYKYTDAIILLSDGQNTYDYWSGTGSSYASAVDDRQKMLCDNIKNKANGVVSVYTIQVNTDNDPDSAILKYCASDGNFFQSKTAAQIELAFQAIGSSLTKLRLQQ